MNGDRLSDEHGFPLRRIVSFKYGYKSPKAILEMECVSRPDRRTWNRIGPYWVDGTILLPVMIIRSIEGRRGDGLVGERYLIESFVTYSVKGVYREYSCLFIG